MTLASPTTIAHLKTHGLEGLFVTCANAACLHSAPFTFAALDLDDDVLFPTIVRSRRFICARCGGRAVNVVPDWRTHRAIP
jgi:hypothetical protein